MNREARIVLLERDDLTREVYTEYLVADGFRVRAEALFDDALAALRKGDVPLLVAGTVAGGSSIAEMATRLARVAPRTAILALVGRDAPEGTLRAVRDGALEALARPVAAETLALAVRRCLETVALLCGNDAMRRHVEAFRVAGWIQRAPGPEAVAGRLLDAALGRLGAETGLALQASGDEGGPTLLASRGLEPGFAEELAGAWTPAATSGAPVTVLPGSSAPFAAMRGRVARLWPELVLVQAQARPGGGPTLCAVVLSGSRASTSAADLAACEDLAIFARQAEFALGAAGRYGDLGEDSIDALTGLYDGRFLERTLDSEVRRVGRRGGRAAVLTIDLEGFRALNDAHGHLAGGRVLVEVARLLTRLVRDVDVVARTGADEFCVVLAASDGRVAARAADRIRDAFGGHLFLAREGLDVRLAVATGHAVFPEDGGSASELLTVARARRDVRPARS